MTLLEQWQERAANAERRVAGALKILKNATGQMDDPHIEQAMDVLDGGDGEYHEVDAEVRAAIEADEAVDASAETSDAPPPSEDG